MNITVYSKENCPACVALKERLKRNEEEYEEIVVGVDMTREDFLQKFPHVRTMPHVTYTL